MIRKKKGMVTAVCLCLLITLSFTACKSEQAQENASEAENPVFTHVDYYHSDGDEIPWDTEGIDMDVPEFPGITFRWTPTELIAVQDDDQTTLIDGTPIWNVFVTDINGDKMPEFCATASFGSGLTDDRIIVYDYANSKSYEISDRANYDYHLSKQDDALIVTRSPYGEKADGKSIIGSLSILDDQQLVIEYANGEQEYRNAS